MNEVESARGEERQSTQKRDADFRQLTNLPGRQRLTTADYAEPWTAFSRVERLPARHLFGENRDIALPRVRQAFQQVVVVHARPARMREKCVGQKQNAARLYPFTNPRPS